MKRTVLAFAVLLSAPLVSAPPNPPLASPAKAKGEDVAIAVAAQTEIYVPVVVKVMNGAEKSSALFEVTPTPSWERQTGKTFEFTGPPGTYTVTAFYVEVAPDLTPLLKKLRASTTISGVPPPPGPTPPGPTPPGPTPPGPQPPTPTAGMIDAPGFHVLIKYDRDAFTRPASETSILNSESVTSVRQHLKNVCTPTTDGQGWRMYPVPAGGVIAPWKAPYERNQGDLPTMTVSKNGKGWEGSIKGWTPEQVIAKCKEIEALP